MNVKTHTSHPSVQHWCILFPQAQLSVGLVIQENPELLKRILWASTGSYFLHGRPASTQSVNIHRAWVAQGLGTHMQLHQEGNHSALATEHWVGTKAGTGSYQRFSYNYCHARKPTCTIVLCGISHHFEESLCSLHSLCR